MPPILITRPQPAADRFAVQLRSALMAVGIDQPQIVISPLMAVEFLPLTKVQVTQLPYQALILTSETGAEAAGRLADLLPKRAFCVGDRTAEAARAAGFEALSACGAAAELAALIAAQPDVGAMLYLHGQDRAADVAALLPQRVIHSVVAYRQNPQVLSAQARDLLAHSPKVILPLMSPRSVRLLAAQLGKETGVIRAVVISQNAYNALPERLRPQAVIAAHPDGPAVIRAIVELISPAAS